MRTGNTATIDSKVSTHPLKHHGAAAFGEDFPSRIDYLDTTHTTPETPKSTTTLYVGLGLALVGGLCVAAGNYYANKER